MKHQHLWRDLLRLPLLDPVDRARFLVGMAVLKAIPNEKIFGGWTAACWMPRLMGKHVYETMWEPILRGKFGARADSIAMSWLWSRVHERSLRLDHAPGRPGQARQQRQRQQCRHAHPGLVPLRDLPQPIGGARR